MKVYVVQIKNRVMINVVVSVRYQMIGVLVEMILCGILVGISIALVWYALVILVSI